MPVSAVLPAALAGLAASIRPPSPAVDAHRPNASGPDRDSAEQVADPATRASTVAAASEPRLARYVDITAFVLEHVRPLYIAAQLPFTADTVQAIVAALVPPPRTHTDARRR